IFAVTGFFGLKKVVPVALQLWHRLSKEDTSQPKHQCYRRRHYYSPLHPWKKLYCFCLLPIASACNLVSHPHFEYPQFKQVWHPSISTSAWVLHLWHSVAPGGKLPASDSAGVVAAEAAPTGEAVPASEFFFALAAS